MFVSKRLVPISLALASACASQRAAPTTHVPDGAHVAIDVENQSEPVLCAEKDNVTIAASGSGVRSFRIEVAHPVYAGMIQRDSKEADWTACDMSGDPVHAATEPPRKVTLYEDTNLVLVGHTQPSFWRAATVQVRVGERREASLHFLQLWLKRGERREEVLVLYPQDGYFRARPLTPEGMTDTAYGSSFLIGPVEREGRPIVRFSEVAFEPESRSFQLGFARGGSATLRLVQSDTQRSALDVRFDQPIDDLPFAMLRSMYVTEFNNDVARIALREPSGSGWQEDNIMRFRRARATDVWMGRLTPSQHNTSSPDVVFHGFSRTDTPDRPPIAAPQ